MDVKRWPVLAQILIVLGCFGGIRGIIVGLSEKSILDIILGIAGLIIFWSVYKLKTWALTGLTILYSLSIVFTLFSIFRSLPLIMGLIAIAFNGLIIYYFNSKVIKDLFLS